jgi:hypothetical protein
MINTKERWEKSENNAIYLTLFLLFQRIKLQIFINSIAHIFPYRIHFSFIFIVPLNDMALIQICYWHIGQQTVTTLSGFKVNWSPMVSTQFYEIFLLSLGARYLASRVLGVYVRLWSDWGFPFFWTHLLFAFCLIQTSIHLSILKLSSIFIQYSIHVQPFYPLNTNKWNVTPKKKYGKSNFNY